MLFFHRFRRFFRLLGYEVTELEPRPVGGSEISTQSAVPVTAPVAAPVPSAESKPSPVPAPRIAPFVPADVMDRLPRMTATDLDALDFGCVRVSDEGLVQMYNKWESDFAGVAQDKALGRNFFRELAPCTNNRLIFGRFKDGIADGHLNAIVSYAFTYKMKPTLVNVHLYRDNASKTNWVLVQKSEARPTK
jgi:photoactive yellow protein